MKIKSPLLTCLSLMALLLAPGCASYKIHPDAASIATPKSPASIRAAIGITLAEQKVTGGFPDLMPDIKKCLDESGLFQTVYYPVRSSDPLDGEIQLRLIARFKADSGLFGKAFVTGFFMFLPAPMVVYKHQYQAEVTMDLVKSGQTLKTYKAEAVVTASHKLFAPAERLEAEGTAAASRLLSTHLTEQLINDRAFLESKLAPEKSVTK